MTTNNLTIGIDLFVSLPAELAPAFLTLRVAPGCALSALPRSVGNRKHSACILSVGGEILTAMWRRHEPLTCPPRLEG